MASLANKTALVTGASRGIGRATAEALAEMGAKPGDRTGTVDCRAGGAARETRGNVEPAAVTGRQGNGVQMEIETSRFGRITLEDERIIRLHELRAVLLAKRAAFPLFPPNVTARPRENREIAGDSRAGNCFKS